MLENGLLDPSSMSVPMSIDHISVLVDGNHKRCQYCIKIGAKTKNGWDIFTRYKCKSCNIPLCRGRFDISSFAYWNVSRSMDSGIWVIELFQMRNTNNVNASNVRNIVERLRTHIKISPRTEDLGQMQVSYYTDYYKDMYRGMVLTNKSFEVTGHPCVSNEGHKQKKCMYCRFYNNKTRSGLPIFTRHKCGTCEVLLRKLETSERMSFKAYHDILIKTQERKLDDEGNE
ncbi:unnamed protein product [Mytilus coruscus]|uniref:PiggyBac transposable element-derived protein 4 C-terminal zinc-finger domain-containing protein n=1 Tax=Mytilus coruscus TaxID=42192 RepID=A0A6J8ERT5_MYTCO|nr:unnamed protein product [Mytilus coruscus]